eukprot:5467459-Pyramimonas_sp.AAC.1
MQAIWPHPVGNAVARGVARGVPSRALLAEADITLTRSRRTDQHASSTAHNARCTASLSSPPPRTAASCSTIPSMRGPASASQSTCSSLVDTTNFFIPVYAP